LTLDHLPVGHATGTRSRFPDRRAPSHGRLAGRAPGPAPSAAASGGGEPPTPPAARWRL